MAIRNSSHSTPPALRSMAGKFRFLASVKLAVVLVVVLASVLAWATVMETNHGRAYAAWFVYRSPWFAGLLALLGVNIFSAAAVRFPWKRHQFGFVITHLGLLILLTGAIRTFMGGVDGRVTLTEGERTDHLIVPERSQITATWVERPKEPPYEFTFSAGPVDWPSGKSLEIGEVDGMRARVLGFFRHGHASEEWVHDESGRNGPAVKLKVLGKDNNAVAEPTLVDQQFGDAAFVGPVRIQLVRACSPRMLEDFENPRMEELGEKGLLTMYYADTVRRISLDDHVGQRIGLDENVSVEIAEYLPHAIPDKLGNFSSKGELPKNPLVELRVHVAGIEKPIRQIALAKDPLLNLDGVYSRPCPVTFRYQHPAIKPPTTIEFLQTSDERLLARKWFAGEYEMCGEVTVQDKLALPGNFEVVIAEHLPHASPKLTFAPAAGVPAKEKEKIEPAALIEIVVDGSSQQVWLQRNNLAYGQRTITTPHGTIRLNYGYDHVPLGFTLELLDFRREKNPGSVGNATFSSQVRVWDVIRGSNSERLISMNQPLSQGRFTLYQSGFDDAGHGKESSSWTAAYDPGRGLKYAGSLMICLGISIMFYMRAYFFKKRTQAPSQVIPASHRFEEKTHALVDQHAGPAAAIVDAGRRCG